MIAEESVTGIKKGMSKEYHHKVFYTRVKETLYVRYIGKIFIINSGKGRENSDLGTNQKVILIREVFVFVLPFTERNDKVI